MDNKATIKKLENEKIILDIELDTINSNIRSKLEIATPFFISSITSFFTLKFMSITHIINYYDLISKSPLELKMWNCMMVIISLSIIPFGISRSIKSYSDNKIEIANKKEIEEKLHQLEKKIEKEKIVLKQNDRLEQINSKKEELISLKEQLLNKNNSEHFGKIKNYTIC